MGKRRKKKEIGITKKQAAMSVREQKARRRLLIVVSSLAIIIVGILAGGAINEYLIKPSSPVAVVNGERITTTEYQKLVQYQRENARNYITNLQVQKAQLDPEDEGNDFLIQYYDQMIAQAEAELANIGQAVLEQMVESRLVRQGAEEEGILISDDMVEQEIEQLFGYYRSPPTPAPTPTPDADSDEEEGMEPLPTPVPITREEYQQRYQAFIEDLQRTAGFIEADYRELIREELYRERVQELVAERVPTRSEQVWARHILVEDQETAEEVLARLGAGEDFVDVAGEYSTDMSNKDEGGDLGWFSQGTMVSEFEEAAFSLPVGQVSAPVQTQFGFHIIRVEDRDAERELTSDVLAQKQLAAFNEWLAQRWQIADIQYHWTPAKMPPDPTPFFAF